MNSEVLLVCIVALLSFVRAWQVREGASGVGIGWAKVLREAKVRASKSKGSEVVGNLHEGARVLVEEVSSKAARIHLPFAGWITLAKASGPVLEQDSRHRRGSGEKSATQWVMEHTLARLRPADGHIGERVCMPSEMPVHPPECPEPADQGAMDTTSKLFAQLPSVGTWLAATPPVSALAAIDEGFPNPRAAPTNPLFVQLPSVGTWLVANASMAHRLVPPAQAAFAQPHSVAHTEPPLAQSVRPACAFTHLPSVATWSMPSEMPVHPPECPEPADQGAMDTTSKLFAQLPSVGTWLAATPPVSALAAIDKGFPDHRAAPTNPLFVQLPSVGTWLVANASMAQRLVPPGCICSAALGSPHRASTGPVRAPSLCVHPSSFRGYVVHALRNACTSARVPRACRPRGNGHHFEVIRPAPLSGHVACSDAARECIGSN